VNYFTKENLYQAQPTTLNKITILRLIKLTTQVLTQLFAPIPVNLLTSG